jgi:hypothetical protein
MKKQYAATRASHYGYTWRGITRPHDRELGTAGGELIVLDFDKNEVLAVKRGFIRSGGSGVHNLTGIWWPRGQVCSNDRDRVKLFPNFEFIKKVLKPKKVSQEGLAMPQTNLSTWLDFAIQQIAAESYFDDVDITSDAAVRLALIRGNNRPGFDPPSGPLLGKRS